MHGLAIPVENKKVSSANNLIREFKLSGKSLMEMRKRNGPNMSLRNITEYG